MFISDPSRLTDFQVTVSPVLNTRLIGSVDFLAEVYWHEAKGNINKIILAAYIVEENRTPLILQLPSDEGTFLCKDLT